MKIVGAFNNKGGVGKTSLIYHLSWMYADLSVRLLTVDLDPQCNLSISMLNGEQQEALWFERTEEAATVWDALVPLQRGTGDILVPPPVIEVGDYLSLLPGDLSLSAFEDDLSQNWPKCLDGDHRAFRVMTAFWRLIREAGRAVNAACVLVDMGPNLGAINRAALIACDHILVPLAPDLFSLQGLKNLGPTLRRWRGQWQERADKAPNDIGVDIPWGQGRMTPLGYIVLQHGERRNRPVKAYEKWVERIPEVYAREILEQAPPSGADPNRIGLVKHYRSLMPMAQEAEKPVFHLTSADGAIGAHGTNVKDAYLNFRELAEAVASRIGLELPGLCTEYVVRPSKTPAD